VSGAFLLAAWALPAGIATALLTGAVRRHAIDRGIMDHPNARSSHDRSTPRGGGAAIVVCVLGATALAGVTGLLPPWTAAAVSGGGLVAGIGWLDDRGGVRASVRALVHFVAAGWAVWCLGGMPRFDYGAGSLGLGAVGAVLAVVGIVWATNFFNFMDGIDGIAASETLTVGLFGGALLLLGGSPGLAAVAFATAGAGAGFLVWNWSPARIFMGDVGSGFLGFLFGTLAVASQNQGTPLPLWLLLLGVFCVDATVTLVRRVARGEVWYAAHREHAYQRAVRAGWSHARVSATVLAVNVGLGLLAVVAWRLPAAMPWILVATFLMLGALYRSVDRLRAAP
jgi:Fuc2NAc and GlcNAc transferase